MRRLREKIGGAADYLETIRGVGTGSGGGISRIMPLGQS